MIALSRPGSRAPVKTVKLDFIISTTLVLLASSKRTILPSGVSRLKAVVVVVTGHSVTLFVVTVVFAPEGPGEVDAF
jgi:hypothetical protein